MAHRSNSAVLFMSAGRRVELLRAFQRARANLNLRGSLVALDIDPLAPALQVADRAYLVPRLDDAAFIPTLIGICRREQVGLILPLIDPDIPVLAANRPALEAAGASVAVPSVEATEIAADKWLTAEFFRRVGVSTPRSWLPQQVNWAALPYPAFIKPRRGSAAKGAFPIKNQQEAAFFAGYVSEPIVQEFLPGPEITNDVVCGIDGEVLAVVSRQRIEVRSGEVAKGVTIHNSAITDSCVRIASALPARGPITVQCIMKGDTPCFTEINARLGGGAPFGVAAGADWPSWLLARWAGVPMEIPRLGSYRAGLYMTRFDDTFCVTTEDRERMESRHLRLG